MSANRSAPENFYYDNANKSDKNFTYKNLTRSKCYNCDFSNSNFDFTSLRGAHFKKCNFYRCSFKEAEFVGTNLKGCKFREAKFTDTIFEGANLSDVNFENAEFMNVIFVDCNIEKAKNLKVSDSEVRIFEEMPHLDISEKLEEAIISAMENKFIKKSRVFDTKEGTINPLTMMILKEKFDEDVLYEGMRYIKNEIDRDFHTLSYVIRLINKMIQE